MISSIELKDATTFLRNYSQYFVQNSSTKIERVLGLFRISPSNKCFALIENTLRSECCLKYYEINPIHFSEVREFKNLNETYDLEEDKSLQCKIKLHLADSRLTRKLENDIEMLAELDVTGYSLKIALFENELENRNRKYFDAALCGLFENSEYWNNRGLCCGCCCDNRNSAIKYKTKVLAMLSNLLIS